MRTGTSTATPTDTPSCAVCAAPALPSAPAQPSEDGVCAFCGSPLAGGDPGAGGAGLLDYVAARVPGADAGRGMLGKGAVRDLKVRLGGAEFHARQRKDGVDLVPAVAPAEWVDRLVAAFTEAATSDAATRRALSRAGWSWRRRGVSDA